jgi:Skp family chaperone for outer membrane proteins
MKKLALVLTTAIILLTFLLAGCQSGIPQEQYDGIAAQLIQAKEEIAQLQDETRSLQDEAQEMQAEKEAAAAGLEAAQARVAELQAQLSGLQEQYELEGATPAETVEKIVRYYHETHVYSTYDLFVCSDMASEVWNMLKAQGIDAVIMVGNKDTAISDILQSNHAWVVAEVASGEELALETTGGYVVPESENPLYYRGWSFDSPRELKRHNELVREYNVRVEIHNDIVTEDSEVVDEYNQATNQSTADKLKAVHDKLVELIEKQEAEMNDIEAELDSLATKCGG